MSKKLHIKKGDTVIVNSGQYRGQKGKVLAVYPKKDRALVEGINMITKHQKPTNEQQDGLVHKEAPIHISNLNPVDPKSGKATRIGRRLNHENKLVRYSKKSQEELK